jgi:hypothetical protein
MRRKARVESRMSSQTGQSGGDEKSARQKRLAEALRSNLRRRKAQQRERSTDSGGPAIRGGKDENAKESG